MAELDTLNKLFEDELRDVYDAEKQILKALPKIIKAASNDELRQALRRISKKPAVRSNGSSRRSSPSTQTQGKHCAGMAGILEEGSDLLEEDGDEAVLDAGSSRDASASSTTRSPRTEP